MSYTNATVIIKAVDQASAQEDFPGSFNSGFYEAIEGAEGTEGTGVADPFVATHFVCSGLWTDSDLSKVTNDVLWPRKVYFGDVQGILDSLNLKPVEQVTEQPAEEPVQQVQP